MDKADVRAIIEAVLDGFMSRNFNESIHGTPAFAPIREESVRFCWDEHTYWTVWKLSLFIAALNDVEERLRRKEIGATADIAVGMARQQAAATIEAVVIDRTDKDGNFIPPTFASSSSHREWLRNEGYPL